MSYTIEWERTDEGWETTTFGIGAKAVQLTCWKGAWYVDCRAYHVRQARLYSVDDDPAKDEALNLVAREARALGASYESFGIAVVEALEVQALQRRQAARKADPEANARPIEHHCRGGIIFRCKRADLRGEIIRVAGIDIESYTARDAAHPQHPQGSLLFRKEHLGTLLWAIAEFTGWHALQIYPGLNGFAGYDTLRFELEETL